MVTDVQLFRQFRAGSQQAFADLVSRHVDWVYSAARRRVRDVHLAEDVTQAVFIALAQSRKFDSESKEGVVISPWLFQVMRYASANVLRTEARQHKRQTEAVEHLQNQGTGGTSEAISEILENSVERLGRKDRVAILLRFYQGKSMAEVGQALGISEEGARKRVSRAVEKLRQLFARRGFSSAGDLSETFSAGITTAAPAALGKAIADVIAAQSGTASPVAHLAQSALTHANHAAIAPWIGIAATIAVLGIAILLGVPLMMVASSPTLLVTAPTTAPVEQQPATRPSEYSIEQVLAALRQTESQFKNVYVKNFKTTVDERIKGESLWHTIPRGYSGSAWYDATPGGKTRIFYSRYTLEWTAGRAPWLTQTIDVAWDGQQGRELNIDAEYNQRRVEDRSARLSNNPPMFIDAYSRDATLIGFTLQYATDPREFATPPRPRRSFSQEADEGLKMGIMPEIFRQTVNGIDAICWKWVSPGNIGWTAWWFDPARGFALIKQAQHLNFPPVANQSAYTRDESVDVLELKQVASGIWFPLHAVRIQRDTAKLGNYLRYDCSAETVVANDPNWDDIIFHINLPSSYQVLEILGGNQTRSSIVLEDGTLQELHRGDVIPRVRRGRALRPDAPTSSP